MEKRYTFDEQTFSDLFKDAYGFRPRNHSFHVVSDDEKQKIWDEVLADAEIAIQREHEAHQRAIGKFETKIAELIKIGAGDRQTAIRWLLQTTNEQGSDFCKRDELEWQFNLPYGYLRQESTTEIKTA